MAAVTKHPEVIYTELEDGAVLLHMQSGFYYSLDSVGLEIWRLIDGGENLESIARALTKQFDVTDERARAATATFVEGLTREQLVVPAEGASVPGTPTDRAEPVVTAPKAFTEPALVKHDEPLHQISLHPFDPQLPLAE